MTYMSNMITIVNNVNHAIFKLMQQVTGTRTTMSLFRFSCNKFQLGKIGFLNRHKANCKKSSLTARC